MGNWYSLQIILIKNTSGLEVLPEVVFALKGLLSKQLIGGKYRFKVCKWEAVMELKTPRWLKQQNWCVVVFTPTMHITHEVRKKASSANCDSLCDNLLLGLFKGQHNFVTEGFIYVLCLYIAFAFSIQIETRKQTCAKIELLSIAQIRSDLYFSPPMPSR